jgi:hypothetical protein
MSDPAKCEVVGRWRITGSDMWDRDFLDLANPPHFTLDDAGHGEIEFGAVHLDLDIEYGRQIVFFRFAGFDEDNEVWGDGNAEIADDGTLEIELHFVDGDEPTLTAQREISSEVC